MAKRIQSGARAAKPYMLSPVQGRSPARVTKKKKRELAESYPAQTEKPGGQKQACGKRGKKKKSKQKMQKPCKTRNEKTIGHTKKRMSRRGVKTPGSWGTKKRRNTTKQQELVNDTAGGDVSVGKKKQTYNQVGWARKRSMERGPATKPMIKKRNRSSEQRRSARKTETHRKG